MCLTTSFGVRRIFSRHAMLANVPPMGTSCCGMNTNVCPKGDELRRTLRAFKCEPHWARWWTAGRVGDYAGPCSRCLAPAQGRAARPVSGFRGRPHSGRPGSCWIGNGGTVRLSGTMHTLHDRQAAAEPIRSAPGATPYTSGTTSLLSAKCLDAGSPSEDCRHRSA